MLVPLKEQSRGYQSSVLLMFEDSYRALPDNPAAVRVPILSSSLDGGRSLNDKDTLRKKRSPGRPDEGNMSAAGDLQVPANIHAAGYIMKMLCGVPTTTAADLSLNLSGSAVKAGAGYVRLGCVGHGLREFTQVTISGSTNYDGIYLVQPGSAEDDIVIEHVFADETFAGTETVRRGAHRKLTAAAAVDKSGGLVGIPCKAHGYKFGETVTLSGTTGYDGDFVVQPDSSTNEIVIKKTFASETFGGTETVSPKFFKHVFKLGDKQPSFALEENIPVAASEDNEAFWLNEGGKVNSFSCTSSGDGQLTFSVGVTYAIPRNLAESVAHSVKELADHDFRNFDGDLRLGGEVLGSVTSSAVQVNANLDTGNGYVKGTKGTLGALSEGIPSLSGSLSAHYTDTSLAKKAEAGVVLDYSMGFVSGGNQLSFNYPECVLEPKGNKPKLTGPQGIMIECQVKGFEESNEHDTCFYAELINSVESYA